MARGATSKRRYRWRASARRRPCIRSRAWAISRSLRATAGEYRVFAIQAKRIEAEAWALLGRLDDAEAALVDVIREAERAEATPTRWRAELALAEVLRFRGDQVGAREAAARALALLEPVMAELPPALSGALAASRLMRRTQRLAAD